MLTYFDFDPNFPLHLFAPLAIISKDQFLMNVCVRYFPSQEVNMLFMKRSILLGAVFYLLVFAATFTGVLWADNGISPAQEQEFTDARGALETARNAQAEKFAPSYMKLAEEFLQTAKNAKQIPDAAGFSRASLLARAYAELAEAVAALETDVEKLAAAQDALQKAKAEIDQLKTKP
jgi:hypothetical protein